MQKEIYLKKIPKFSEHFSRVEFLPESLSYFDASSPLDLKSIYIIFSVVAVVGMVSNIATFVYHLFIIIYQFC